jgi:hypothetical protein
MPKRKIANDPFRAIQPVRLAGGWCWFVLREKYCWLVADGWFVLREKYCWLVADKPSEQADRFVCGLSSTEKTKTQD